MVDLVLKTRLEVARSNLLEVDGALESVDEWRAALAKLVELHRAVKSGASKLDNRIAEARGGLLDGDKLAIDDALNSIAREIKILDERSKAAAEAAEDIRRRLDEWEQSKRGKTLSDLLHADTKLHFARLREIEKAMLAATDAAAGEGWQHYLQFEAESRPVFSEYVDLLGGYALRDTGLDRGICRIADALVTSYGAIGDMSWNSLTVPAQREALGITVGRIIRLGFPEWTIWAIPLAAHEFGYVLSEFDSSLKDRLSSADLDDAQRARARIYLADASATFVLGPAYACTALLMRLDPWRANEDDHLIAKRAWVILQTLKRINARPGPLGPVIERLRTSWEDTLRQTRAQHTIDAASEQELTEWIDIMENAIGFRRVLPVEAWKESVLGAVTGLKNGASEQVQLPGDEDQLRLLLNAAWMARLDTDDDDQIKTIAKTAHAVWDKIESEHAAVWMHSGAPLKLGAQGGTRSS